MKGSIKRAFFSVDSFENIIFLAQSLHDMGWQIIASAETVRQLQPHGIAAENVADFVGVREKYDFPPTLHPKMETALTMDPPYRIDLVYDIPYPLSKGNDVGGRTLLALGAKGRRIVTFCSKDLELVIDELIKDSFNASIPESLRTNLIDKAHSHIAEHYLTLARRNGKSNYDGLAGQLNRALINGENPYQVPSDLFSLGDGDPLSATKWDSLNPEAPCFTNLADIDSILQTLCLATEAFRLQSNRVPYIAIAAKHGNACGMAVDWETPQKAISKALMGNPLAVWGGEFIVNFKIDEEMANTLLKSTVREERCGNPYWMLDVIAAPDFDTQAIEVLGKRQSRKLLKNGELLYPKLPSFFWSYRQVRGGFLRQPQPDYILDLSIELGVPHESNVLDSLIVAWSVAFTSSHGGNEVAIAKNRQLLGAGGGPSTLAAGETAVLRAKEWEHDTTDSIFAADAFFPFTDAPEVLRDLGCRYGVVPTGGKNESLVKSFFQKHSMSVVFIPEKYRGFCRH
jgi:phosphoribosylaminoimidazolecarboxamide formyltransferase / IMP cyclohydrolase